MSDPNQILDKQAKKNSSGWTTGPEQLTSVAAKKLDELEKESWEEGNWKSTLYMGPNMTLSFPYKRSGLVRRAIIKWLFGWEWLSYGSGQDEVTVRSAVFTTRSQRG